MNPRWPELESLLDKALDLASKERASLLEGVKTQDPELHAEVERWLRATEQGEGFLDQSGAEYVAPIVNAAEESRVAEGARIGPYRIAGVAGHGGMGTVYLAEREEPYHQRVALKLVRGAVAFDDHVVRRLVEERQILASLEHPHIARLVDGGVTDDGLPWFAMEYVEGEPIDSYCNRRGLQLEPRLDLFLSVCDAVQYAHQHLVVHRDLKPSNILVTSDGQVKLLDFGIAKVLEARPVDPSSPAAGEALTRTGLRVLTPEYASPEQVRGEPVTVRSDVYSLGVLLYELLVGRRPYRLADGSPRALEQAILEREPERPSAGTDDPRMGRRLRGDLDTIVLTALRKEPARRYQTADRLAGDLRRYLEGLPVTARPDTWRYRSEKFARRHRLQLAAGALVVLSLLGGLAGTAWQARVAATEAAKQRAVKDFLIGLFQVSDPEQSRGRAINARELLEQGTRRADSALARAPELQSELLHVLGVIHRELGLYGRADTLLGRAVRLAQSVHGPHSDELAARLTDWGSVLTRGAKFAAADSVLRAALAIRRMAGADDSSVAETLRALGEVKTKLGRNEEAEGLYREALAIDRGLFGNLHPMVALDLSGLGTVLYEVGKLPRADSAYRAGLAIRREVFDPSHPAVLASLHDLAQVSAKLGSYDEADQLQREVLETRRRLYPDGHPDVATALKEMASVLMSPERPDRRLEAAEALLIEALALQRSFLGSGHPETINTLNSLALARYWAGDLAGAERGTREVLESWRETLGDEHRFTLTALTTLGGILREQGRYREAEPLVRRALALRQKMLGDSHEDVANSWAHLGHVLLLKGDLVSAESAYRQALAIDRRLLPPEHPLVAYRLTGLGKSLTRLGRAGEAEPLLREAVSIRVAKLGPTASPTSVSRRELGICLARLGRYKEAEALLLESYRTLSADEADWWSRRDAAETARWLAEFYSARGRHAEAATYAARHAGSPR